VVPTRVAAATDRKATTIDVRLPRMIRLSRSRPYSSVPSRCSALGPCSRALESICIGFWGVNHGANTATATMTNRTSDEATTRGLRHNRGQIDELLRDSPACRAIALDGPIAAPPGRALTSALAIADSRIDHGVAKVGQQIEQ